MRRPEPPKPNRINPVRPKSTGATHRPAPVSKTEPPKPEPPKVEAGPRPLSPQQRAYQDLVQGGVVNAGPLPAPVSDPISESRRVTGRRDATISRKRVVLNRRRPNYWKQAAYISCTGLVLEIAAIFLFSPKLNVKQVEVTGNAAISQQQILAQAKPMIGNNIVRFPYGKLSQAILQEPTIEKVELHQVWPDRIHIVVHERQPWASVQTPDGKCYTIDSKLVPFRKSTGPEKGLPHLTLALSPEGAKPVPVILGKKMTAPGLTEVSTCLEWAKARPDFPMESVSIDPGGKLCFNRVGGTEVRLGSAMELPRKLSTLSLLMQRYNIADAAYVNLFAYDAPAVMPKSAVATASSQTRTARTSSSRHRPDNEVAEQP